MSQDWPWRTGTGGADLPGRQYSEVYPHIAQRLGLQRLLEQFSFPGGIPSHVAPETPGSINEGGELALLFYSMHTALYSTTRI